MANEATIPEFLEYARKVAEKRGFSYKLEDGVIELRHQSAPLRLIAALQQGSLRVRLELFGEIEDLVEGVEGSQDEIRSVVEDYLLEVEMVAEELEAKARSLGLSVRSEVRESIMDILDELEDYLELIY
ncbi:MAG: hypothetical protein F7C09_05585 [Aeropyrum sp.]|nr:hypothetical protein [Aeropyrum sp.]